MLALMLVAVLSVSLVSCGDDDNEDDGNTNANVSRLKGGWSVTGVADDEGTTYNFMGTLSFSNDGRGMVLTTEEIGTRRHACTLGQPCIISDNQIVWKAVDSSETETFSYVVSDDGKKLTMKHIGGTGIDGWKFLTIDGTK